MGIFPIAAALAAAALTPAPRVADADPAMWVVNDDDTTIYLFGTFHALDGKSDWFNDEVRTAFAASDELVLETIVPARLPGLLRSARTAPGAPQHVRSMGVDPSASFLASTRMAVSAGQSRGMKVAYGADTVLRSAAENAGKKVEGLESFDFQLDMFGRMPAVPARAPAVPVTTTVSPGENLAIMMGQMQAAWNRGDQAVFGIMLDQMRTTAPESYAILFTKRNSNWAGWIADRLDRPGTVFVAVGAGHLAGEDSVQAKLADLGVRSARIN